MLPSNLTVQTSLNHTNSLARNDLKSNIQQIQLKTHVYMYVYMYNDPVSIVLTCTLFKYVCWRRLNISYPKIVSHFKRLEKANCYCKKSKNRVLTLYSVHKTLELKLVFFCILCCYGNSR